MKFFSWAASGVSRRVTQFHRVGAMRLITALPQNRTTIKVPLSTGAGGGAGKPLHSCVRPRERNGVGELWLTPAGGVESGSTFSLLQCETLQCESDLCPGSRRLHAWLFFHRAGSLQMAHYVRGCGRLEESGHVASRGGTDIFGPLGADPRRPWTP